MGDRHWQMGSRDHDPNQNGIEPGKKRCSGRFVGSSLEGLSFQLVCLRAVVMGQARHD